LTAAPASASRHRYIAAVIAVIVVLLATFFITGTYKVYEQTYDESAHVACGMEWLSQGTYDYESLHPPLARAATALLPFLQGARSQGQADMLVEGNAIFHLHGDYWRNLTLSRLGVLPFFWLLCFVVYRFMAERFSAWHAAVAVMLLALCPPVLAHTGLATTDAPLMAMFTWSLLRFWRFLEKPSAANAVLAGLIFSLAALTKFTELPFYLLAAFLLLLYIGLRERRFPLPVRLLLLAILVIPPTLWAGYRFSYGPVFNQHSMGPSAAVKLKTISPRERALLTSVNVPADQFFRGLIMAKGTGSVGRLSYLLGHTYKGGRRMFFPVALSVKTPLPLLLLFAAGLGFCLFVKRLRLNPVIVVLLLGVACPLLVGIAGQMNIGLRHVLPVYPFMAMLGAIGAMELWGLSRGGLQIGLGGLVLVLLAWELIGTARSAPDFLPYFNEIAAGHADHFLVNSDLDWGQDLARLESKLRKEHAPSVAIDYFGDPDADESGLPEHHALEPGERPTGWVAVSDTDYIEEPEKWGWLGRYPYTWVGHSIRLYHLASPPA
jgi:4-amino-4-deoxy-L-arabinose transferase-like glycosyltransferase